MIMKISFQNDEFSEHTRGSYLSLKMKFHLEDIDVIHAHYTMGKLTLFCNLVSHKSTDSCPH